MVYTIQRVVGIEVCVMVLSGELPYHRRACRYGVAPALLLFGQDEYPQVRTSSLFPSTPASSVRIRRARLFI